MYIKRNCIMIVKLLVFSITISLFAVISYIGLHSNNFFIQIYAKETLQEISKNNTAAADKNQSLFSINLYQHNFNTSKLETPLINLIQNISLPNVIGRMDH